ncbi:MAG: hypothetical protein WKF71_11680 [Pyrinomonadaceae bacterium]
MKTVDLTISLESLSYFLAQPSSTNGKNVKPVEMPNRRIKFKLSTEVLVLNFRGNLYVCSKDFIKRIVAVFPDLRGRTFYCQLLRYDCRAEFSISASRLSARHQQYHRMMEIENQRLNEENARLKANAIKPKFDEIEWTEA